ncbi:hypothetical protein [Desulfoplanes formicivorans]|uniref:Type II secretion system protein GspE N-terminal domain-containing protein n=1 Tax=Desulfoplanes formicivorans TaxID=1592317 RepID=A0A194AHC9_9BACT|nr:hypothetical protein [Desulfoplanes formicivorans]GAU08164.1 hypothetical protein DPF_0867 [Desulfoplanes formicivorans]
MNVTFFGQFLLDQGLISQKQLNEAISFQRENNALLGSLALEKGLLTREQVLEIMREQQLRYEKFGEIAIRKQYLTEEQVRELLNIQGKNHVFLGEALTRRNYLSIRELNRQLDRFDQDMRQKEASIQSVLQGLDDQGIFVCAYEMIRKYLYRLGYATHVCEISHALPSQAFDHVVFLSQKDSQRVHWMGVYLPDVLAYQIAYGKQPTTTIPSRESFQKEVARLLGNLNVIIGEEMHRKGVALQMGEVRVQPPEDVPSWTCLHIETLIETYAVVLGTAPVGAL